VRTVDNSTHFSSGTRFLVQISNKYGTRKGFVNHFSCDLLWFYSRKHVSILQDCTVKYVRKGNSFVLSDFWGGNKTLLDRSHLKTAKTWKISQFLCTARCVSPSAFPFLSPVRYFIFTPFLVQSTLETVTCVPDSRTDQVLCSNLVSGICKGKYMICIATFKMSVQRNIALCIFSFLVMMQSRFLLNGGGLRGEGKGSE